MRLGCRGGANKWSGIVIKKRVSASALAVCASILLAGTAEGKTEQMVTSWYQCCNDQTASGYPFKATNRTIAAHRTLPFGTKLLLAYNGREVCSTVRDRGPFTKKNGRFARDLDVTRAAAEYLGFKERGIATLQVTKHGC